MKKITAISAFLLCFVALFSTVAFAFSFSDEDYPMQMERDKVREKAGIGAIHLDSNHNDSDENELDDEDESDDLNRLGHYDDSDENELDDSDDLNKLEEKHIPKWGIQGKYIAEIEHAKNKQLKELQRYLKENGYRYPKSYFTLALNQKANELKEMVRLKLSDYNAIDANFSISVVKQLSEREFAKLLEQKLADLNISDQNLFDEFDNSDLNQLKEHKEKLKNEFRFFSLPFKKKILAILLFGSAEEKQQLTQQVKDYIAALKQAKQERQELAKLVKETKVQSIREKLKNRESIREMVKEIEEGED